ncbi:conserved hypothetical protein [Trichinella spiralis]|uniref:hypothetical protein n=1 Tax=Trichinella spiralis TaxID=6334 RepID=UPI0001EFD314|nr:conserved hypothetical protein [Trichinella spiralis]
MHLPTDIGLITCQYNVLSMLTPFLCNNCISLLSVLSVYNLLSEFFGRPPPSHLQTTTLIVMPLVTTIACITAVLVCGMDAVAVLKIGQSDATLVIRTATPSMTNCGNSLLYMFPYR